MQAASTDVYRTAMLSIQEGFQVTEMKRVSVVLLAGAGLFAFQALAGTELCFNGTFDHTNSALEGWTYNYEWLGNEHFMDNHTRVSVSPREGTRRGVMCIDAYKKTKVDSKPMPFEAGARYRCTFDLKGGSVRAYFAGYKWKPGVRPHPDPHVGRLRMIYKGKPFVGSGGGSWRNVSIEVPLKDPSDTALRHLKRVRFLTVFFMASSGRVCIDNVKVSKVR